MFHTSVIVVVLYCQFNCQAKFVFSFAAEIRFEQGMYAGVEGDNIEVCVVVENGVLENDLTVPIVILPSSTATGKKHLLF